MRVKLLAALAACALSGAIASPAAPAATPTRPASASRAHGPTVTRALQMLLQAGSITQSAYTQYFDAYVAAKRSLGRLSGTRHEELGAVLENTQQMAAAGQLIASRLPAVFLTLERNRQWWTTESLLSGDERVSFPPSELVWEYYPGQGIQIQWLATFGKGNGYYLAGHENANLRQLVSEVLPLATQRAGGIAWEYLFHFDGGAPPWTSGLSQGTGLEVLSRAYSRFKEPADLAAAKQALGVFETPPPEGVRVQTPTGALYAEYTYAPGDHIINGFIQALVGLYEYTAITREPLGEQLFEAGDAEARALTPHFDTGAWSLYDQYGESNLNYHELLAEFLEHLCERTRKGAPLAPADPPGTPVTPIAGDDVYCSTAERFQTDLHTPPVVALLTKRLRTRERGGVQMQLSKVATVQMVVRQGARVVWRNTATVEGGRPRLLWVTPSRPGTFAVTLTATDLAGNFATTSGTVLVTSH